MKKITIYSTAKVIKAMTILEKTGEKCLLVIDKKKILLGTLTDGDIRRNLIKGIKLGDSINKIYNKNPLFFQDSKYDFKEIKKIILKEKLDLVPIVDNKKKLIKYITWKDLFNKNQKLKINKIDNIPVIIMAGGKGRRLGVFSKILPKPLLPINDKTLLENILDYFKKFGLNNFYITINYRADLIKSFFSYLKGYKIKFIQEKKFLGTAGSLNLIKKIKNKNIIVSNCDIIFDFDLFQATQNHIKNINDVTLIVTEEITKIPYGICKLSRDYLLEDIVEKPEFKNLVNTGMYIIKADMLKLIKNNEKIDMNIFLKRIIKNNYKVGIYEINKSNWLDYGDINKLDNF